MITIDRAETRTSITWLSLLGLVLVPLLIAGGFLWATWGSSARLDRVDAAIVNLDEPVTVNKQLVPLGRQLAGGLVTGGDEPTDQNFSWLLTDATDARQGLADGRYAAVVTIPENFSKQATSFSQMDANKIAPAEITVQTTGVAGITDAVIGQAISSAATSTLNTELTKQYLDQIYVGFNETGKQFETVAKAAGKLADGSSQVSDGIDSSATGAGKLADGLDQLATGAGKLSAGAGQLSTGTGQLANGLDRLAAGTKQLPTQTRTLANGAQKAADGAGDLDTGVQQLGAGTKQNAAGLRSYAAGLEQYRQAMNSFKSLSPEQLAQALPCPFTGAQAAGCPAFYAGFIGGTQAAVQGLDDQPKSGGSQPPVPTTCPTLAKQPSGTDPGLLRAATLLCDGAGTLSSKVNGELVPGVGQLSGGLDQFATGTDKLADGLKPLAAGIAKSATGAQKLASGADGLASGTSGLAGGARQSATGADQLADGLDQLAGGGRSLADGTQKLADGLATGADKVPSYDKITRTKLAETVATPVTQARPDSLFPNTSSTTFLAILALWLGGLASFLVLRAIPSRVLTSMKSAWRLALEAFAPAAVISAIQAVALSVIFQLLFGLGAGATLGLTGLLLLAGLSFAALNQALVAWWGGVGRFVSVAVVVLSAAAAITSALPEALTALVPFLPLTPALDGARALVTGGSAGGAAATLLVWLLVGVAGAWVAVARGRQLPAMALARA